jgi:polyhydroxybutyrate depolymerase
MMFLDVRGARSALVAGLLMALPVWLGCGGPGTNDTTSSGQPESGSAFSHGSSSGVSESGAPPPGSATSPGADTSSDFDATLGSETGSTATDSPDGGPEPSCVPGASDTANQPGYLGDWTPGDYPSGFADAGSYLTISGVQGQMGNAREYAVHVPTGYHNSTPVPALFCIHGLGQTASLFCLDPGVAWPAKGDREGFVVIMPNGYQNSWNGGTCCGGAAQAKLDDVALMRAIFAEVGKHVNIDLRRVYATGLSNGGFMSYRLACEASDLFVAVAPSAGAVGTAAAGSGISALTTGLTTDLTGCSPTHKVSVLDIHGTSDPLVPYADQAPSLALVQAANGCSATQHAASVPPSGGDTTCVSFTGCTSCPKVQITGCTVDGGGHCWFGSNDCGTGGGSFGTGIVGNNSNFMKNTDSIWNFFAPLSR